MATECLTQLTLGFQPKLILDFHGGEIPTDCGLLLLRQFDGQLALTKSLKGIFNDWRHPAFIEHHVFISGRSVFPLNLHAAHRVDRYKYSLLFYWIAR
jgi:hypothetical protein